MKKISKIITSIIICLLLLVSINKEQTTYANNKVEFVLSVELFTVGGGYLVEPVYLSISEGDSLASAVVNALKAKGYVTYYSGEINTNFYLAYVGNGENSATRYEGYKRSQTPANPKKLNFQTNISLNLKNSLSMDENIFYFDETDFSQNYKKYIGEFVYTNASGFMYCVNNEFTAMSMGEYKPKNDDVIRIQFSLAYGQDIGGAVSVGADGLNVTNYYAVGNKDELTRYVANINQRVDKDKLLSISLVKKPYLEAIDTLKNVEATNTKIENALYSLKSAVANAKTDTMEAATTEAANAEANTVEASTVEASTLDVNKTGNEQDSSKQTNNKKDEELSGYNINQNSSEDLSENIAENQLTTGYKDTSTPQITEGEIQQEESQTTTLKEINKNNDGNKGIKTSYILIAVIVALAAIGTSMVIYKYLKKMEEEKSEKE